MNTVLLLPATAPQVGPLAEAISRDEPGLRLLSGFDPHDDATLAAVPVMLGWRFPRGLASRLTGLRWVCSMAAGVEKLLVPDLAPDVPITRVVDPDQALGMAQYTAAVVLRQVRGLARYDRQQQRSRLDAPPDGRRAQPRGGAGLGRGRPRGGPGAAGAGFHGARLAPRWHPLRDVLADAQVVVNTLPLTPQTHGLLDARAFAAMPRGAYLVNMARGGHVVEADLIAAVQSRPPGRRGAGRAAEGAAAARRPAVGRCPASA
jgi:glyoxylate/hydroxypyruvate reductase A